MYVLKYKCWIAVYWGIVHKFIKIYGTLILHMLVTYIHNKHYTKYNLGTNI